MGQPIDERRRDTRYGQPVIAGTQAILRPGYSVALIDLSVGGALIQGSRPLRPGSRVYLQLLTESRRIGIAAHVLRCAVVSLDSRQGVQYRGALKFDHRCDTLWEDGTLEGYLLPDEDPAAVPDKGHGLPMDPRQHDDGSSRQQE